MSFNAVPENKILAKISEFAVTNDWYFNLLYTYGFYHLVCNDAINLGWFILHIKGYRLEFSKVDVLQFLNICLILANSALGSSLFTDFQYTKG